MKLFELRAQLINPFVRDAFWNLGNTWFTIGKHWILELEHCYYPRALLDMDISIRLREDHQGFDFTLGILGYGVHLHIYDMRHYGEE